MEAQVRGAKLGILCGMTADRPMLTLLCSLLAACSAGGGVPPGSDGGGGPGTDSGGLDAGVPPGTDAGLRDSGRRDAGRFDPFDPDAACGVSTVPTERVPGSLLLVFDRSGSMDNPPSGDSGPTKWDLATEAINTVLSSVSDELSAGLLLFPTGEGSECNVSLSAGVPQVAVAPLSTSRPQIMSALSSAAPTGGNTPMFDALRAGWRYLDTLDAPGQRGVVLVTDGAETCDEGDRAAVRMQAATELATNHYLTFAVGLDHSNNDLSTIAYNGGTPRNDTCMPECTSDLCSTDADCPGAGTCSTFLGGFGFCSCATNADCVAPQTCEPGCPPFFPGCGIPPMCAGEANCCHYNAAASSFRSDFEAALDAIARRFLESCVFDVPRGSDPTMFDASLVNVGVTFEGEPRTVLPQSSDPDADSWNYTDSTHRSIIIQGPICDRLLMGSAVVEIVLGCPTILI